MTIPTDVSEPVATFSGRCRTAYTCFAVRLLVCAAIFCMGIICTEAQSAPRGVQFSLNSFLGNLTHSELRPPTVKTTPEDRTAYLDRVQELGVTSIRETFMNWAEIEPERDGGYVYSDFDDLAQKASVRNIEIIALFYPFPPWATGKAVGPITRDYVSLGRMPMREFETNFRRFVRSTVLRYCGCSPNSLKLSLPIRQWIFFNEPDVCKVDPNEYAHWLKAFYEEVKRADPTAKVIAPAVATAGLAFGRIGLDRIDPLFLSEFLRSDELKGPEYPYFDILTFHNYPVFYGTETGLYSMNAAYGYVRKVLKEHKLERDIWITETGDNSPDRQLQADHVVKLLVHAASVGVNRVHLHGLWDFVEPELWGVLENSPSGKTPVRKASFFAVQTLLRKMRNNNGVSFLGPGRYRVLLPNHENLYVVWAGGTENGLSIPLSGQVLVTELDGKARRINARELRIAEHPVFVQQSP